MSRPPETRIRYFVSVLYITTRALNWNSLNALLVRMPLPPPPPFSAAIIAYDAPPPKVHSGKAPQAPHVKLSQRSLSMARRFPLGKLPRIWLLSPFPVLRVSLAFGELRRTTSIESSTRLEHSLTVVRRQTQGPSQGLMALRRPIFVAARGRLDCVPTVRPSRVRVRSSNILVLF
jgi:hypothetical protein